MLVPPASQHFTEYSVKTGQVGSQHYPYNIGTLGNLLVPTGSQHFTEWLVKFRIHHLKTFYCPLLLFQAPLFRLPVLWPRVQRDEQQSDEAWNDCLIYFVPLLCSLVESTAESWREMLQDEQGGLLLYQQNLSQIQEVCTYPSTSCHVYILQVVVPFSHRHFVLSSNYSMRGIPKP